MRAQWGSREQLSQQRTFGVGAGLPGLGTLDSPLGATGTVSGASVFSLPRAFGQNHRADEGKDVLSIAASTNHRTHGPQPVLWLPRDGRTG